jgi:hypothetical protein
MLDCPLHDLELVPGDGLHTFDRKLVNLGERVEVLALARQHSVEIDAWRTEIVERLRYSKNTFLPVCFIAMIPFAV